MTQAQRAVVVGGLVVLVGMLFLGIALHSVWLNAAIGLLAVAWFIALGFSLGSRRSAFAAQRLGTVFSRVIARCIDSLILLVALLFPATEMAWDSRLSFVSFALFWFLCYPPCEYFWGGTPGKLMLRLRVAGDGDGPPSWRAVTVRSALSVVAFIGLWPIELVVMNTSKRKKRLGDMAARTVVERS